ncbi:alpha/beta hydrolase [Erwinia billingiae]|uniref:alpha/beta hydrolase n=1 Tax=Erwinia billingiae TaxID=182337 RepID=UPI000CFFC8EE|nr:alpha/beta hydrolase [Erwinia billingiae]PRB60261.1 alpha/beta hydrolase [Erwinia billingiae]
MKLHNLSFIASLVLAGLNITAAHAATSKQTAAPQEVKNIVLVHGLFADASSWSKVITRLQAKGLHVTAVQNPTTSLDDDVASVKRALALQKGPVILVAHSYGGMVISQAGDEPEVKGLVYIAARAPAAGENYPALTKKYPASPASAGIQWKDNFGALSESAFIHDFAGDLPENEAKAYYAVQQPMGKAITMAKTTVAAWEHKPTYYAVSTQDRTINPDLERFMAKRMHAYTIELTSSHVSLISQPESVANLIMKAAHVPGY